ncbi:uncharacterized protein STEHIDRAFT_117160 [Stereum hirsutum FP-91666 SS1]|uniref:uncharacterized protein n=1 Tax=Stereum hirsutum (strain FP-91666) TaxID=721885 RepID=UPI000440CC62|nr:uncharacterized protein STEHIDRAFT_117160 [Stereum hirsutum FP-91666 SS1]EIM92070.1 hypothetical protein STEHIDRAFT_117160 [Stereum hirsutum FP-91666 SS1]
MDSYRLQGGSPSGRDFYPQDITSTQAGFLGVAIVLYCFCFAYGVHRIFNSVNGLLRMHTNTV